LRVSLRSSGDDVVLAIQHDGLPDSGPEPLGGPDKKGGGPIGALRERVILTGGELNVERDKHGWTSLRMRWRR
jgi:signal transduction histidine kinase